MVIIVPAPASPARQSPEPLWRQMLGHQIRRLRHARGETLLQTARRAGVSPQYLSEVERGTKEPSSELIASIARALEVRLLDLTVAVTDDLRRQLDAPIPGRRSASPRPSAPAGRTNVVSLAA